MDAVNHADLMPLNVHQSPGDMLSTNDLLSFGQ
jgi:hypothetical protein